MEGIQEVVRAAKEGNREAFNRLYEETYKKNYYIVVKMLKQEQDALDVLQDTYIKVFQNLDSFQYTGEKSFASWTGKIASNTALDFLRKKRPVLFSDLNTEEGDISEIEFEDETVENQPEMAVDRKETARVVQEMLECLSEEQRICVIYRYVRQMKISEIAIECGCSENTIKSRLNYAKKRLLREREVLAKKGIHLYNVAPFTALTLLLGKDALAAEAPAAAAEAAAGIIEMVLGGQEMASAFGAKEAGKAGAKGVKSIIEKWGAGKIISIIVAAMVLLGAGAGIYLQAKGKSDDTEVVAEATTNPDGKEKSDSADTEEPTPSPSEEPTPKPKSEKEVYYEYLNEELVPKYGLVKLNQKGTLAYFAGVDIPALDKRNQWLKPIGILSAYIKDLDQDGKKEMFVLYWKEEKDEYSNHELMAEVYEQEEEKVTLADSAVVSGLGYTWDEARDIEGLFVAADMTIGKNHYLLFSQHDAKTFFADGFIKGMCSMEYRDRKLQTVQEVLQTGGGSAGFEYTGYTYKEGKKEEELLYDGETLEYGTEEERAAYSATYYTMDEAFIEYFKREKLDVSEIMEGYQTNEFGEVTKILSNLHKTKGATLICTVNSEAKSRVWTEEENSAKFFFTGKDKTNLRKYITKK